jgi:hypothetical protein
MSTQTSPNDAKITLETAVIYPRNLGRGIALDSAGTSHTVIWDGTNVRIDGAIIFALAVQPFYLDFAFDTLDRPQVSWALGTGEAFIYFYDGTLPGYRTLSVGFDAATPAICNDYALQDGVNTILVYVKSSKPYYRLQRDRFTIEYLLLDRVVSGILQFGYGVTTNSVQMVLANIV